MTYTKGVPQYILRNINMTTVSLQNRLTIEYRMFSVKHVTKKL